MPYDKLVFLPGLDLNYVARLVGLMSDGATPGFVSLAAWFCLPMYFVKEYDFSILECRVTEKRIHIYLVCNFNTLPH